MTQIELSEALDVDQSTVSRWERGVEQPRPRTFSALRDLLMKNRRDDATSFYRALVAGNLAPAVLYDESHRLVDFSDLAEEHYRSRLGLSLRSQIGWDVERHANRVGLQHAWEAFQKAGLGREDVLWLRMIINYKGMGHATIVRPFYTDGDFAGWSAHTAMSFDFPKNNEYTLERLEAVYAEDPAHKAVITSGLRKIPF